MITFSSVLNMSRVCVGDSGSQAGGMSCSWANMRPERSLELSDMEMEAVTTVFRSFETGLREASIDTKVGRSKVYLKSRHRFETIWLRQSLTICPFLR